MRNELTQMEASKQATKVSFVNIITAPVNFIFGEYTYADGDRFGPLLGRQLEIIYLRTGKVSIACDSETFEVSAPSMVLMFSTRRLEYQYGSQDNCHVAWCQCSGSGLTLQTLAALGPMKGVLPPSDVARTLMELGVGLAIQPGDEPSPLAHALAIATFQEFFDRKYSGFVGNPVPQQIELVRQHIDRNFEKPASMPLLAKVSGLSPQHLNKLYQSHYGENPLDYLWRLRTRQGAFLLQHTGLRVSQIAYRSGFKTPNHFARCIKKRFGISPRALRAQRWHGSDSG
jgi:AraC-like DNA-binding protein